MGETVLLYRKLVGARIRSELQYRTSFVLFTIAQFFITFIDFLAIAVIFHNIPQLGGWSIGEVAFLYATAAVAFGLADLLVSQVENTATRIRLGTFDVVLIRPLNSLFQIVADDFALRRVGKLVQAAAVLVVALSRRDVGWTTGRVLMVPVMIAAGAVIYSCLWVITASVVFWTVDGGEMGNAVTYGGNFLTQYPLHIYGTWIRRFLGFAAGAGFVSYFPSLYVLGKDDPLGMPGSFWFASPAVAAVAVAVAALAWRSAVRHYRSTGS